VVCKNPSAELIWDAFCQLLTAAINMYVPTYVPAQHNINAVSSGKPFIPKNIRKCAAKKRRLWNKLRTTPNDFGLRVKYRACCLEWRRLVRKRQIVAEEQVIASNNLGAFYRFVNRRLSNRSNIGVIIDDTGQILTDCLDKANAFNKYFASIGISDNGASPLCPALIPLSILDTITITEQDVLRSVNRLKTNSSGGPDGIPPVLLKGLKHCLCHPLAIIFNQFISVGYVPSEWRKAYIVPVPCIVATQAFA